MPPERPFLPHDHFPTLPPDADQESVAREQKARAICQMGNHRAILESFREPENHLLLEEHKKSLQSDPHILDKLSDILPSLTAAHWEMLALLDLFDPATFDHCVRTYQIIERKLKSAHPVGAFLETELKREGVTKETLAISALLHDVGKMGIPLKDLILNNSLTDHEWHHLCREYFCEQDHCGSEAAEAKLSTTLEAGAAHNLREKDLVPFSRCLKPEEERLLTQSGIDPHQTLGEIINQHQDFSGEIAREYGLDETFIALVSNHHERPLETNETLPVSKSALHIASILRFADVFDAIHSARTYKKGNPFLTTIALLIQKSQDGFIDPQLAHLWIEEDIETFRDSQEDYFRILPEAIDREHEDEVGYGPATREAIIQKEMASLQVISHFLENKSP